MVSGCLCYICIHECLCAKIHEWLILDIFVSFGFFFFFFLVIYIADDVWRTEHRERSSRIAQLRFWARRQCYWHCRSCKPSFHFMYRAHCMCRCVFVCMCLYVHVCVCMGLFMCIWLCMAYALLYGNQSPKKKKTHFVMQYPVPMKKETQGKTDLYIGSWLKSQPRDKVLLAPMFFSFLTKHFESDIVCEIHCFCVKILNLVI